MRRTARVRSLAPVAVLAFVAATTAGCNSDSGADAGATETVVVDQHGETIGGDPDALPAMTPDEISQAVLQDDNMGEGWTSTPYTADEDSAAPGCLADVKTLTAGLQRKDKGGTDFTFGDTLSVESTVSAYADATLLAAVFDQVQVAVGACTSITGPDGDGNNWDVTLTSTDDAGYEGVDDQYTLSGTGTLTDTKGTSVDIFLEQTAVRIGANVASIVTFDLSSRSAEHDAWAQIAVDRFVAVAGGDEPAATTAPAPAV